MKRTLRACLIMLCCFLLSVTGAKAAQNTLWWCYSEYTKTLYPIVTNSEPTGVDWLNNGSVATTAVEYKSTNKVVANHSDFAKAEILDLSPLMHSAWGFEQIYSNARTWNVLQRTDGKFEDMPNLREVRGFAAFQAFLNNVPATGRKLQSFFKNCPKLETIDFTGVDFGEVANISQMFSGCTSLKSVNLSGITKVTTGDYSNMFLNCKALETVTAPDLDLSAAVTTAAMFRGCTALKTITVNENVQPFSTGTWKIANQMFDGCVALENVDNLKPAGWNTQNVTNMLRLFALCEKLQHIDVSGWNLSNVIHLNSAFQNCKALTTLDVSNWNVSKVENFSMLFRDCQSITTLDVSRWSTDAAKDLSYVFADCHKLTALDVKNFKTDKATTLDGLFLNCALLTELNVKDWNTTNVTNFGRVFMGCTGLSEINVTNWQTPNATVMTRMFALCENVPTLDVAHFDVSKVTDLSYIFQKCYKVKPLDISGWNVSKVQDFTSALENCTNLETLDVSQWNTASAEKMKNLFYNLNVPELKVGGFTMDNVTTTEGMFYNCANITELDVANWNTGKVENFSKTFNFCKKLETLDVSRWNTSSATDMSALFNHCYLLPSVNVSGWNTEKVENFEQMFNYLERVRDINVSRFNTAKAKRMTLMFGNMVSLTKLVINNFDGSSLKADSAVNFTANDQNLEYIDMSKAKNFSDTSIKEILSSQSPNPYTLKYIPKGNKEPEQLSYSVTTKVKDELTQEEKEVTNNVEIPVRNIITNDGTNFHASEYHLSDDTLKRYVDVPTKFDGYPNIWDPQVETNMKWEIVIPYGFKADKVTNNRRIGLDTDAYTWYMPYNAPIPAGLDVYEFVSTSVSNDNNELKATFQPTKDTYLKAQKPYLVVYLAGTGVETSVNEPVDVLAYDPTPLNRDIIIASTPSGSGATNGWNYLGTFQWRNTARGVEDNLFTLQANNYWKHYRTSKAKPRPFRGFLQKPYADVDHVSALTGSRLLTTDFLESTDSEITGMQKIELLDSTDTNNSRIYDLNGRYLGTRRDTLRSGTYVIDGKKVQL